ncbi:hypothetical protein [Novosphingobium sp. PY1]|uniref:Amino acid adenylation domain protein n=1 Tax=Ochrobactrum sp. PW1 TaxID=1882222 RepID=A0A292GN78_9HYPH|nr:hypothetical protein [Novosphingobium sp. PY1]BBA74298.1 amino acid adenylation domain protein [Ochrobactrum sp. PW1]GFM29147.1 amino acid adenylation domain protein [Novosphingobium sp. PY1]
MSNTEVCYLKDAEIAFASVSPNIRRKMIRLARAIGSPIDPTPHLRFAYTGGSLLLGEAGLLVMGTSLPHRLMAGHCEHVASRHGFDVIVLRSNAEVSSYDFYFHERRVWLTDYRWWEEHPGLAFAPCSGMQGPLVQAMPTGLRLLKAPGPVSGDHIALDNLAFAQAA